MTPEAQLQAFAAKFDPGIAAQGMAAIDRLRTLARGAVELAYDNYNALAVGFGPSEKPSEAIVSIAFYPRWVTLFFLQGAGLDDPGGLLAGEGARVRSIRLSGPEDLDRPEIRDLITQALACAKVPLDPSAARRLVVRSVSARQRPRRP